MSIEDLARVSIKEFLAASDERLEQASEYVLKKKEELYVRLV
jgi:hypothetical protein